MRCPIAAKCRIFPAEVAPISRMQSPSCDDQMRATSANPLERRVNLCAALSFVSGVCDDPRNSFMNARVSHSRKTPTELLRALSADIDFALQVCTLFNGNPLGRDIPHHHRRLTQVNPVAR